jgi:hypothetical protein
MGHFSLFLSIVFSVRSQGDLTYEEWHPKKVIRKSLLLYALLLSIVFSVRSQGDLTYEE